MMNINEVLIATDQDQDCIIDQDSMKLYKPDN